MEYIKYGNAGIEVSRICLGAMTFPWRMEEKEATDMVRRCHDRGLNFIDTADSYPESEEFLGKALQGIRDDVIISTKVWASRYNDRKRPANCSRHNLINAVERSLRKLQTDYIDIYMCHHPDPLTPFEETYSTLDNLVKQGKIRYLAMCNAYDWQVAYCLGLCGKYNWEPPVSLQVSYNLIDRVIENETLAMARRFNMILQTYGPQGGGLLTGKYQRGQPVPEGTYQTRGPKLVDRLTADVFDVVEEVQRVASKYNITMGQLSVVWVMAQSPLIVPIIGGSKAEHIDPLLDCPNIKIEQEDLDRLTELTVGYRYRDFMNQPNANAPATAQNWV